MSEVFARRLKQRREQADLSQVELADRVHVDDSAISSWEAGRHMPGVEKLRLLAQILGTSMDYLAGNSDEADPTPLEGPTGDSPVLTGLRRSRHLLNAAVSALSESVEVLASHAEAPAPGRRLALMGSVPAGIPDASSEYFERWVTVPSDWLRPQDEAFLLTVRGDSMEPFLKENDLVVVRRQKDANPGDMVVAVVDNEATIKWFDRRGDKVVLRPDTDTYRPITLGKHDSINGKVVGVLRQVKRRRRMDA